MIINRDAYLQELIKRKENGLIKVITGIRRCGKSFLLFNLYYDYLVGQGVPDDHIIQISLDEDTNAKYRNPMELSDYVREQIKDKDGMCYIFIDEIQFVKDVPNPWLNDPSETIGFVDVLLGLMKIRNADIYVTGSNSRMLSKDVVTQFRDRGDEVRLYPLSFQEFYNAFEGDKRNAWREYYTYGGLPRILMLADYKDKSRYLQDLIENTYVKDVLERNDIKNDKTVLDALLNFISSAVGSLTSPNKLADTFRSREGIAINSTTVDKYLGYFEEAFITEKAERYDIKGRKYIGAVAKYYYTDIGLRNAKLNFRQQEENHIMENILYMELRKRGYSVDVGIVEYRHRDESGKDVKTQLEVDFVAKDDSNTYYIQSALNIDEERKKEQEIASLVRIPDSFKKIVIIKDNIMPWRDERGILYIGIEDVLLSSDLNSL
ncbi:MAG: ATP-binding protein [Eubacteriales bacterium]|nr:ATP-binding protein [Eubacteriales bacterium]